MLSCQPKLEYGKKNMRSGSTWLCCQLACIYSHVFRGALSRQQKDVDAIDKSSNDRDVALSKWETVRTGSDTFHSLAKT